MSCSTRPSAPSGSKPSELSTSSRADASAVGPLRQRHACLWDVTEVEEVSAVTGSLDLLVRVRVRDHAHMRSLLLNELWHVPGLQGTETMVALAEMAPKPFLTDILEQMQALTSPPSTSSAN